MVLIEQNTFDLIVVDYDLPDANGRDFVNSIHHIDSDVPMLLMMPNKAVTTQVLNQQIRTIKYPFKPLRFLRLVDHLINRQLNRYRQLATTLNQILDTLQLETGTAATFLIEDSDQILMHSGDLPINIIQELAHIAATKRGLRLPSDHRSRYGLYRITVVDDLRLVLLSPPNQKMDWVWEQLELAALDIIVTFHHYNHSLTPNQATIRKQSFIPLNPEMSDIIEHNLSLSPENQDEDGQSPLIEDRSPNISTEDSAENNFSDSSYLDRLSYYC